MSKLFVLDTNILLHDPMALRRFGEHDILIPITVIEEMDNWKKDPTETGRNAREVGRQLDKLREEGELDKGVELETGGILKISFCPDEYFRGMPKELSRMIMDNRILAVAHYYSTYVHPTDDVDVIFVSNDANARIKANAIGIFSQIYKNDRIEFDSLFTGTSEIFADSTLVNGMYQEETSCITAPDGHRFIPNECVTVKNKFNPKHTALARYNAELDILCRITDITEATAPTGLIPRNREQRFAMDLLLDPNIQLVTLVGKAGTGKTLMAIAAGLYGVLDTDSFDRLLVSRPVISLGKQDLGFLPGDIEEKMAPWMMPIHDNIEVLLGKAESPRDHKGSLDKEDVFMSPAEYLKKAGKLEVQPLFSIRGRSIPRQYLIVDEAQNLTPHEVKTIITRAGEGTKIVLTGDPEQIDNPYVDSESNGLTYAAERFKNESISGHITLTKGERSPLAELAARLL